MAPDDVIQVVKDSGLRGRGGAGFPTGMKWSFVPQDTGKPTYVTVNFDESEPGTCNNRELMERDPHQMLEGAMIAAYAIRCHTVFVYCRGEFLWPGTVVQRAIAEAYAAGYLGTDILGTDYDLDVVLHRGAGAYICGEETALLSSLEGLPGTATAASAVPRGGGPVRVADGDQQRRDALERAAHRQARRRLVQELRGPRRRPARRCSRSPGRWSGRATTSCRWARRSASCSRSYAGGMLDGGTLKAWTPGGSSTPLLTAEHLDVGLDFESIAAAGSLLGTGA